MILVLMTLVSMTLMMTLMMTSSIPGSLALWPLVHVLVLLSHHFDGRDDAGAIHVAPPCSFHVGDGCSLLLVTVQQPLSKGGR